MGDVSLILTHSTHVPLHPLSWSSYFDKLLFQSWNVRRNKLKQVSLLITNLRLSLILLRSTSRSSSHPMMVNLDTLQTTKVVPLESWLTNRSKIQMVLDLLGRRPMTTIPSKL